MAITTFSDAFGTNLSNSYRCAHAWMFEHALGVRLLNLNSRRSIRAHAPIFHAAVQCSILQKVAVSPTFRRTLLLPTNEGFSPAFDRISNGQKLVKQMPEPDVEFCSGERSNAGKHTFVAKEDGDR